MTYGVGIVGTGGIAERHATAYDETSGIDLRAAADVDADALDAFGERWGVPADRRYPSHEAMLASGELDAVSICSPTFLHRQHVVDVAGSSTPPGVIFCEKPIATSVADAREMVETCEDRSIELLVDHTRRFHPSVQRLREFVQEQGGLGDPISVSVQWAGELLRNGTHVVDLLLYFLDTRGREVSGGHLVDVTDTGNDAYDDTGGAALLHLADGTLVTLDVTRTRKHPARVTEFVGTDGRLRIDWWDDEFRYWECTDTLVSPRPEARESLYGDFDERSLPEFAGFVTDSPTSFRNAAAHVRDLLDGKAENISPGRDATDVLELLVAIYVSHAAGGSRVDVPLERPLRGVTVSLP